MHNPVIRNGDEEGEMEPNYPWASLSEKEGLKD